MEPIIQTKDLSVIYDLGKSSETPALQGVNIEIYPEEYVIFFGPSGCGKSTLLYCLAGIEAPTQGEIWVKGQNLFELSSQELVDFHRSQIGMIFQAYYLIPSLSVLDNVILPQIFGGVMSQKREKKARQLLSRFEVLSQAHKLPSELSGGQQQRVAICRALINDPSIILADEPVGNLDSKSAQTVMGLLEKLNREDKKTVILVTHDPHYLHYAHRVFHMKDGRVIREVINPEKRILAPAKKRVRIPLELEALARTYPHLSQAQLKAKALAQYLVTSLDEPEIVPKELVARLTRKSSKNC
jgi:putative ABC transport system ATP-binding protein